MNSKEEVKIVNIQLISTFLFILSLVISLLLTYNSKLEVEGKKGFLNDKQNYSISVFNRIFIVCLSLAFLYTNIKNKEIAKSKSENTNPFNLQIMASELSLLAALIVTYVVVSSGEYSIITSVENPSL